ATLISEAGGSLIGNNAGSLTGTLNGPAPGVISNNGGSLVGNNAGSRRLLAAAMPFLPLAGVSVDAFDDGGRHVVAGPALTDSNGTFAFDAVLPSGPVIFLSARFEREGRAIELVGFAPAPRAPGKEELTLDPAGTLVVKHLRELVRLNALVAAAVPAGTLKQAVDAITPYLTDATVAVAVAGDDAQAARAFDALVASAKPLSAELARVVTGTGSADLAMATPSAPLPPPSPNLAFASLPPGASPPPATPTPPTPQGATPTPVPTPTPFGATPTPIPSAATPTPAPTATPAGATPTPAPTATPTPTPTPPPSTTLAGTGTAGFQNGPGALAQFNSPIGLAFDAGGNLLVGDANNHAIRKVTAGGTTSTFAGSGAAGTAEGTGTAAQFDTPWGLFFDASTSLLYVGDTGGHRIRQITSGGVVSTFVGNAAGGFANGTGAAAGFAKPRFIVRMSTDFYIADETDARLRKVTPAGVATVLAGAGVTGFTDGTGAAAKFDAPLGLVAAATQELYLADRDNHCIRKIDRVGVVTTLVGGPSAGLVDGNGAVVRFNQPHGLAFDANGNLYVADRGNHCIRKVTPFGAVTRVLGSGIAGYADGPALSVQFKSPAGVILDAAGNLYVADSGNNRIRKFPAGTF
ncbi:MAG: repeat containing protein, partial [Cyanobacteria bacterium RYN_339]|nr:repeat containing protein [Cyanobacteria bacterium RYN_339]